MKTCAELCTMSLSRVRLQRHQATSLQSQMNPSCLFFLHLVFHRHLHPALWLVSFRDVLTSSTSVLGPVSSQNRLHSSSLPFVSSLTPLFLASCPLPAHMVIAPSSYTSFPSLPCPPLASPLHSPRCSHKTGTPWPHLSTHNSLDSVPTTSLE